MSCIGGDIPAPNSNQDCQGLLIDSKTCGSWLRKRSFRNKLKIFAWPWVFCVTSDGCIYYYRSEMAKTPTGCFSLYGYNVIQRAVEIPKKEALWAFKIIHTFVEYKTYYFCATSEQDMKDWMKRIKAEMKRANRSNQITRTVGDGQEDDNMSQTYADIETKIYDDPQTLMLPSNYKNRTEADVSDDEDDMYSRREPQPPPLPKRREASAAGKEGPKRKISNVTVVSKKMEKVSLKPEKVKKGHSSLQRGSPEGESVKVKVKAEVAHDEPDNDDEEDQAKYWESIYFKGHKEESSEIIRKLAEEGVYMIRDSDDGGQVLVVFVENIPKKYKIYFEADEYYLSSKGVERFESIEELCYHYYSNDLPTAPVKLTTPYSRHPAYTKL